MSALDLGSVSMLDRKKTDRVIRELAKRVTEADILRFFEREAGRIRTGSQPAFAFRSFSPSLVAYLGTDIGIAHGKVSLAIGFPFPLRAEVLSHDIRFDIDGLGAGLAWHMVPLHRMLRRAFFTRFASIGKLKQISDPNPFTSLLTSVLSWPFDLSFYIDLFRFTGDSVSYFGAMQSILERVTVSSHTLLTINPSMESVQSFQFFSASMLVNEILRRTSNSRATRVFLLLPNFIDDQWPLAASIILTLVERITNLVIVMPGRNMMICVEGEQKLAYHLSGLVDPSLWVTPREILSTRAVEALVGVTRKSGLDHEPNRRVPTVFVHGCTSNPKKDLSPTLAASIVRECGHSFGSNARIEIGTGISGLRRHQEWCEAFARECGVEKRWVLVDDSKIVDLDRRVQSKDCIITADTSVAHLAYHHRKGTVCLYNRASWDARCVGSLFHHSAFGFAYAWPGFFVCIIEPMDSRQQTKLARSIGLIVEILAGVKSLTPQVADSIRTIASDISRAVFKATTLRSATSRLKAVLADFYHSPISSDPAMETCLFDWLGYGEIEFALESDQRMERPLNELLHQFVRLHPATKLAALIETGRVLVGADRPRI